MLKKLAELTIHFDDDYYNKVIKALEAAGLTVIKTTDTMTDKYYIIAEEIKEN